eukprot:SAG31_NODE_2749_length_5147_cov_1.972662_2_plen_86_part_00
MPIAFASTIAYVALKPGTIDWLLAACIGAGLAPCVAVGSIIAHKVPADQLRLVVAVVLCLSTIFFILKLALEMADDVDDVHSAAQ